MDMLVKDNGFMSLFIDMLRELPCLWEINHPHYKNQAKRKAALEQLCEIVKQVIPTADMTYLKILIGGLRSTYVRERKKVLDSQRSGAADDIYVPRMWYYDRLHFLVGQTEPRPSLSSLPSTLPSPPAEASDAQPGPSRQHVEEPRLSQVLPVLLLLLTHLQQHSHSQEGSVEGRPESEDPGSSLVGQKMQPLVVPQPGDTDVICCFPDLCEFWTRLPSLTYGLLRPPILMFKN
ncbi:hypothetical protein AB205_0114570 [Aquarana catesbeiana]|uniref:MADF domain-containing protein n=1 Tax=Aquarana catesbeiana TaxID=8400 RepID=A0A2G9Q626_AQUCT|nr:hypothetical protein AB205_0114570 [Aquarana catesbeiana]